MANILGYDTTTDAVNTGTANTVIFQKFVATGDGTVTVIKVYFDDTEGSQSKAAIYSHNATDDQPNVYLGYCGLQYTSVGWNTFVITPVNIVNGTTYWLAVHQLGGTDGFYYKSGTYASNPYKYFSVPSGYNFPNPFVDPHPGYGTSTNAKFCIYVDSPTNVSISAECGTASGAGSVPSLVWIDSFIDAACGTATAQGYAGSFNDIVINAACGTATAECLLPTVALALSHPVLAARYLSEKQRKINRVYVIGKDDETDNLVFGEATDNTGRNTWGEMLTVHTEQGIQTTTDADTVAANILSKIRLNSGRGVILIPINCGIELYDVISITDSVANQSSTKYRVSGYTLHCEPKKNLYNHVVKLTTV